MAAEVNLTEALGGDCAEAGAFFRSLKVGAAREGVPLSAIVAPTYRCNFRCVHCYAREAGPAPPELATAEWIAILDQLAESGCLLLLITGGEPLLRPDFADIYRHAKAKGMLVTVFTNASLVDDASVKLFKAYPPRLVDVSLYGMSEAVCRAVTGVAGMFERSLAAVRALRRANVPLGLKTVALRENAGDVAALRRWAAELGVRFRFDTCVTPALDRGRAPMEHRLPVAEAMALEFAGGLSEGRGGASPRRTEAKGPELYRCTAGRAMAFVGPDGSVSPCLMAVHRRYGRAQVSFQAAWERMVEEVRGLHADKDSACIRCDKWLYCAHCPAVCYLDVGNESGPSPALCELGMARALAREGKRPRESAL